MSRLSRRTRWRWITPSCMQSEVTMKDEFEGMGGSYVVGKDGKRALVERTQEPAPVGPTPEPADVPAIDNEESR